MLNGCGFRLPDPSLTYGSLWQIQLAPISTQGAFTTGNKASGTVQLTIGADVKNA